METFMGHREEAAALERKIYKKSLRDIQAALDNLKVSWDTHTLFVSDIALNTNCVCEQVSENVGQRIINSTFKEIEKQLNAR